MLCLKILSQTQVIVHHLYLALNNTISISYLKKNLLAWESVFSFKCSWLNKRYYLLHNTKVASYQQEIQATCYNNFSWQYLLQLPSKFLSPNITFFFCTWLYLATVNIFIVTKWNHWVARQRVHWHKFLHVRKFWWAAHERQSTVCLEYETGDMNLAGSWVILYKLFESACDTTQNIPKILVFWSQGTNLTFDSRNRD